MPAPNKLTKPVSLFKRGLVFAIPALGVLLLLQASAGFYLYRAAATSHQEQSDLISKHFLAAVNNQIDQYGLAADNLASNPAPLLAALGDGGAAALEAQLQHATAGSVEVRVVPPQIDPAVPTTLTYGQQDMVGRVAQSGKALPAELARLQNSKVLALARPLMAANGSVQGVLIVSFPYKSLGNVLDTSLAPDSAKLELAQGFGADPKTTIIAASDGDISTSAPFHVLATHDPNWELHVAVADHLGQDGFPLSLLWGLLAAGLVLVSAAFIACLSMLARLLGRDATAIDNYSENLLRYGEQDRPQLLFDAFDQLVLHLQQYVSELRAGKGAVKPRENQEAGIVAVEMADEDSAMLLGPAVTASPSLPPVLASKAPTLTKAETAAAAAVAATVASLPAEIFRAYDIRGRAGVTLTGPIVYQLGLAIGSEAIARAQQTVIVGRDCRLSGPELFAKLIEGLQASGRDVIDIGMVPTPVLYFAASTLPTHTAVMLTGSHNPAEDNGLKIVIGGRTLVEEDIRGLKQRIENQDFTRGSGGSTKQSVSGDYIERISADVVLARSMTVVVDAGNGIAGPIGSRVLEALGCTVIPLFCEPDGRFPNHQPDPSRPENMEDLVSSVVLNDADLGISFDGDGDRIGVVTAAGKVINTDRLMMLFAKHVLVTHPGADIIFDVKCSRDLINVIASNGGRPVMTRTGHSYLKAKLAEHGAPLAGEMSGHVIFNDRWLGFDDAIYAAARVLEILSLESDDSDAVFDEFPESVATPEISVAVEESFKQPFMASFIKRADFKDGNVNKLDGIRVDFSDGWGLLRASNTTPNLVMRFEGRDEAVVKRIQEQFKKQMLAVEPVWSCRSNYKEVWPIRQQHEE